ncbi:MAG: DUF4386 family protein [Bryobacter sp.]|nr:DUF4386 family protein [Bryobacter sp.]
MAQIRFGGLLAGVVSDVAAFANGNFGLARQSKGMSMNISSNKALAVAYIAFPLLVQGPFAALAAGFQYPDVLRLPPARILAAYAQGMAWLPLVWYLYGLTAMALVGAMVALPEVLHAENPGWLRGASRLGVLAGLAAVVGLWRWVFAVPVLARLEEGQLGNAATLAFEMQHLLLGNLVGEHVGQLLLAGWTAGVAISLGRGGKRLRFSGLVAAAFLAVGSYDALSPVFPVLAHLGEVPLIGFLLWSAWCVALGVRLWRQSAPGNQSPSEAR